MVAPARLILQKNIFFFEKKKSRHNNESIPTPFLLSTHRTHTHTHTILYYILCHTVLYAIQYYTIQYYTIY